MIPVSVVLDCLAAGPSDDEILRQYPTLTVDAIRAAAAYGASLAREEIRPLPAWKLKLDENLPHDLTADLAARGHDVHARERPGNYGRREGHPHPPVATVP